MYPASLVSDVHVQTFNHHDFGKRIASIEQLSDHTANRLPGLFGIQNVVVNSGGVQTQPSKG